FSSQSHSPHIFVYHDSSLVSIATPPSPTQFCTLSLHDALPICHHHHVRALGRDLVMGQVLEAQLALVGIVVLGHALAVQLGAKQDRKSTRLNSSHVKISYAVFCLKKKITITHNPDFAINGFVTK